MKALALLNRSLSARLLAVLSVWTIMALATTGLLLSTYFRQNAERNFDELLQAHAFNLMGAIDVNTDGTLTGVPNLGDPRFLAPLSGWSWIVSNANAPKKPLLFSNSLAGDAIDVVSVEQVPFNAEFQRTYRMQIGQRVERRLEAQLFLGDRDVLYQVMVSGNLAEIDEATARFSRQLFLFFSLFGLGTIIVSAAAVRFGLVPLDVARQQLNAVREGDQEELTGQYPKEVSPLISEINGLIASNKKVTERARLQVGNLAHALKTPLAVINNEVARGTKIKPDLVSEQAGKMQDQIGAYLNRARIAAQVGTLQAKCDANAVIDRLLRVMGKLSSHLEFVADKDPNLVVSLEQQDFEEILGNLLENASHYASSKVALTLKRQKQVEGERPSALLEIHDDGPGVPSSSFDEILKRGKRLDETIPGTGLGLSIVCDIIEEYEGDLNLDQSHLGGLKVAIILPVLKSKSEIQSLSS